MRSADDDALAAEAAAWLVRLTADDPADRAEAAGGFEHWKRQDPRHARAAAGMEGLLGQMQGLRAAGAAVPVRAARAALGAAAGPGRPRPGRRAAGVLALLLGSVIWLGLLSGPGELLFADLRSGTGQWQARELADGSRLSLGSGTAVELHYGARERGIELLRGEILLDVAKDAQQRPLVVHTAEGSIRALGTRLLVRRDSGGTELTMLESRVAVSAAGDVGTGDMTVRAGQRLRLTASGLGPLREIDAAGVEEAWQRRRLVVQDRPLPEVLDELARHRPGLMRFDRERLAGLRVSAVLPLDDPDGALRLLQASFPQLRQHRLSPYLLWIDRVSP